MLRDTERMRGHSVSNIYVMVLQYSLLVGAQECRSEPLVLVWLFFKLQTFLNNNPDGNSNL